MSNPMQMMIEFNKFRNNFRGNPREEVEKLVAEGKITQDQLNQLQNMASQFQQMMKSMK